MAGILSANVNLEIEVVGELLRSPPRWSVLSWPPPPWYL